MVLRESVRTDLLLVELNNLYIIACENVNTYLNAPYWEKIWTTSGPEFGDQEGLKIMVYRELYGLNSSGAACCEHLSHTMYGISYNLCEADLDVLMKTRSKLYGFEYYEYIFIYIDDVLSVSHKYSVVMYYLHDIYHLKVTHLRESNSRTAEGTTNRSGPLPGCQYW